MNQRPRRRPRLLVVFAGFVVAWFGIDAWQEGRARECMATASWIGRGDVTATGGTTPGAAASTRLLRALEPRLERERLSIFEKPPRHTVIGCDAHEPTHLLLHRDELEAEVGTGVKFVIDRRDLPAWEFLFDGNWASTGPCRKVGAWSWPQDVERRIGERMSELLTALLDRSDLDAARALVDPQCQVALADAVPRSRDDLVGGLRGRETGASPMRRDDILVVTSSLGTPQHLERGEWWGRVLLYDLRAEDTPREGAVRPGSWLGDRACLDWRTRWRDSPQGLVLVEVHEHLRP